MKSVLSRVSSLCLFLLAAALVLNARADNAGKAGEPVPNGDVRSRAGFYSVVFYFAPNPAADTSATARNLVKKYLPGIAFTSDPKESPTPPFVGFEEEQAPLKNYPVPDKPYFKYAGRGLTDQDITTMQRTAKATRIVLVAPKEEVWKLGRKFTELTSEFATTTKAYIWDSATRECFSREAWEKNRLISWPETGIPELHRQITIHLYRPDDQASYLRAITLGMEKFALPDIVIERLAGSDNRPGGNLINLVCQSLAENPVVTDASKDVFRLDDVKADGFRKSMTSSLEKDAKKEIALALLNARTQEGDTDNRLVEISFQNGTGKTEDEKREDLLSKLWGARDSIKGVRHSVEILEASKRAKARLPELREKFIKGFAPGERLLVKAPFLRDDAEGGNEWMWVEVMKWPVPEKLQGILQNDPFYVSSLKAGARVPIHCDEIFDYILYHQDGTTEGNETGKLMETQGGPTKTN